MEQLSERPEPESVLEQYELIPSEDLKQKLIDSLTEIKNIWTELKHYPTKRSGSPEVADTLMVTLPQGPEQMAL